MRMKKKIFSRLFGSVESFNYFCCVKGSECVIAL